MKQNLLITCAALAAVSIMTAFLVTVSDLSAPDSPDSAAQTGEDIKDIPMSIKSPVPENDNTVQQAQYYLREYQGKLAVFLPEQNTPEKVFDVYLSTLPSYDRGQLQLGVPISDYEELVRRIEDYIS